MDANREMVNSPAHYKLNGGKEVIDYLEEFGLGPSFTLGNALKYLARAGKKFKDKTDEDIKKAEWYMKRLSMETDLPMKVISVMVDGLLTRMKGGK